MCWFVCSKEDDDDWEIREDFSVFICFQNMCLAIYLFSAIKIQYPQAIIITTIRGGRPLLHSPAKCRPRAASEIEICLRPDSTRLWLDVVDVVVLLLLRAPMNFLPGCTSNEGLWSYAQILALVQAPPAPPPLVSSSPRSFSKFNCARNLSFC